MVARLLADHGATLISADLVGHSVYAPDGPLFADVAARWPSVVVEGRVDRLRLAGIVFADRRELADLEALTHPLIIEVIRSESDAADGPVVVESAVMLSLNDGWHRVFVDANESVRLARSIDRGGDTADMERRAAAQPDRETWLEWADDVIVNEGTIVELEERVEVLWEELATGNS